VLVFVRGERWREYGTFLSLNSPWLDDPIIAARDASPDSVYTIMALYPEREVWFYDHGVFSKEPFPYPESEEDR
jgi:hypothetical protein